MSLKQLFGGDIKLYISSWKFFSLQWFVDGLSVVIVCHGFNIDHAAVAYFKFILVEQLVIFVVESNLKPLMPGGNKKVTHT